MPTPPLPSRDDDEHGAHGEGDGFRYYAMLYRVACDVEMGANGPTVADPIRTATGALQGMLHEAVARANTAKAAADLMRDRAEKAERERGEAVAMLKRARDFAQSIYDYRPTCRECETGDDLKCAHCGEAAPSIPFGVCDYYAIEDHMAAIDAITKTRG